jgi:chaperone modulatory protein CbpM
MKRLDDVLTELRTLNADEVMSWIEARWVLPDPDDQGLCFRPVDVARLRLIQELRHELLVDADTMPLVLSLVDEMYALRRRLGALAHALAEAPSEVRTTVFTRCQVLLRDLGDDDDAPAREEA